MAKRSVLLRKHPPEAQQYIQRTCKLISVKEGETVYEQGTPSEAFYMIDTGRFRATQTASDGASQQVVREFGPGETFGSHELLASSGASGSSVLARSESVTALEAGSVWMLPKKAFDAKLKMAPAPGPKLLERVRNVPLFAGLGPEAITLLCRAVVEVRVDKGESVCAQGEAARFVYALEEGQLKQVRDGEEEKKQLLRAPAGFGEECLYPDEEQRVVPQDTSAWAGSASLLKFAVADIEALLGFGLQKAALVAFNAQMLRCVHVCNAPLLDGLEDGLQEWLAACVVHEPPRKPGEMVVAEGTVDEKLYIIRRGRAVVKTTDLGEAGYLEAGQFFGELALTGRKHRRGASVANTLDGPLHLLSLSRGQCVGNARLAEWVRQLDQRAELAAQAQGHSKTAAKSTYATGGAKKRATFDGASKTGGGGGGKGGGDDDEEDEAKRRQLLKRKSYGELMVDAQRVAKAVAEKAARSAMVTGAKRAASEPRAPKAPPPPKAYPTGGAPSGAEPRASKASKTGTGGGTRRGSGVLDALKTVSASGGGKLVEASRSISRRASIASTAIVRAATNSRERRNSRRSSVQMDEEEAGDVQA